MAVSINWLTGEITVPRADMPVIQASPEIRELDTDAFFTDLKDLEASEEGAPWPDTQDHNLQYTLSGDLYAQKVEIIPPYFVTFEDGQYGVKLTGSNNNILDVATQNQVRIASTNSAGLIAGRLQAADVAQLFAYVLENGETFAEVMRLVRAEAAGTIVKTGVLHEIKSADGAKTRITSNADEDGRVVTATDGT